MKINFPAYNNISFSKRKEASCAVAEKNGILPCSIYKMEESDSDYLENLIFKKDWEKSRYIIKAYDTILCGDEKEVFVIEDDENNKCLGFCITEDYNDTKNLAYIETMPKLKAKNKRRNIKYVGEALIAFLMKTSKPGRNFHINDTLADAVPFYEKCGFKYSEDGDCDFIINDEQKENLISAYEELTRTRLSINV